MQRVQRNSQQDKLQPEQLRLEEQARLLKEQQAEHNRQVRQRVGQEKKSQQHHSPGRGFSR
ncbi:hypothetical protein [Xenorhabdus sp. TS4]|uniref:hypothetical protein n=1 Tax=Xenorhabdus sp. TS4 TaxID=1873483 RepID=UPI0016572E5B|nr:hypothetical protein [Xenorhabdus sp. TS4]